MNHAHQHRAERDDLGHGGRIDAIAESCHCESVELTRREQGEYILYGMHRLAIPPTASTNVFAETRQDQ